MNSLTEICEVPAFLRVMLILKNCFKIACILVPIIIMITIIMSISKVVISGKQDEIKENIPTYVKKIIAGLVVFLLPTIIPYFISLTGEDTLYEFKECTTRVTEEEIAYYEKIESITSVVENMVNNPTKENIDAANKAIDNSKGFLKEDTMIKYLTAVSNAEVELEKTKKMAECENKGGTYNNGYCMTYTKYQRPTEQSGGSSGNGGSSGSSGASGGNIPDYDASSGGNGTITINALGGSYDVVNTNVSVVNYVNYLRRAGVYQGSNSERYGDKCLGFSYTHAWGLYSGNTSYNAENGLNYTGAGKFKTYINDSLSDVLGVIYNEVSQGRPVILQVNGNKKGTSRHFVTVVGYRSGINSASSLTDKDLLIIDSWDARLERMDTASSRFVTTGKACHKDYSGYRIQYLK